MQKLVLGILFVSVNGLFLWLLAHGEAGIDPLVIGAAAVVFNALLGIRIGYASAQTYSQDVARLNRYLGDQNEDLVLCNRELLERFASPEAESVSQGHEEEVPPARAQG